MNVFERDTSRTELKRLEVVREESDNMEIEETVKSWTDMFKHKHLLIFEVRWRDHGS